MDMVADGGLQQRGGAYGADGLTHFYCLTGGNADPFREIGDDVLPIFAFWEARYFLDIYGKLRKEMPLS